MLRSREAFYIVDIATCVYIFPYFSAARVSCTLIRTSLICMLEMGSLFEPLPANYVVPKSRA